eukprot:Skav226608  [mRNA]  locus=scaffold2041:98077:98286:- [translate_table: standard]
MLVSQPFPRHAEVWPPPQVLAAQMSLIRIAKARRLARHSVVGCDGGGEWRMAMVVVNGWWLMVGSAWLW